MKDNGKENYKSSKGSVPSSAAKTDGVPSANQASKSSATSSTSRDIKEGWGSRSNFQASYGLKMTPEDIEEGDAILRAMQEARCEED